MSNPESRPPTPREKTKREVADSDLQDWLAGNGTIVFLVIAVALVLVFIAGQFGL